jgi:hypothetical protein
VKGQSKPNIGTQAQGGGNGNNNNKKKKKKAGGNQPLAKAPTTTAAAAGGAVGGRQEATNAPISCPIATTAAQSARCTTSHAIAC